MAPIYFEEDNDITETAAEGESADTVSEVGETEDNGSGDAEELTRYIESYAEENGSPAVTGTEASDDPPAKKAKSGVAVAYDYIETFCYALAVMMILFLFVFRYVSVDGESMRETLNDGDKLIISNLFYTPKTGDIVVINPESHSAGDEPIIKRVIAVGGQKVIIDYDNWEVYVDGVKLDEPYIEEMRKYHQGESMSGGRSVPKYYNLREFTVDEGKVFVMGDNRNNSSDSRDRKYGEIGVNRILGKVLFRIYPNFGPVN